MDSIAAFYGWAEEGCL